MVVWLVGKDLSAQQFFFSEFYLNKLNLNPAYAVLNGRISFTTVNRTQWMAVPGGYNTNSSSFAYEQPIGKDTQFHIGGGLLFNHSIEGSAALKTTQLKPVFAMGFETDTWVLRGGVAHSIMTQNYNQDNLIFSDQINPYTNNIVESTVSLNSENLPIKYSNYEFGVVFEDKTNNWTFGMKGSNLIPNKDRMGLNNLTDKQDKYVELFGVYSFDYDKHGQKVDEITLAADIKYYDLSNSQLLSFDIGGYSRQGNYLTGLFFRSSKRLVKSTNALSFHLGYVNDGDSFKWQVIYAIDANVGGLAGGINDGWPGTNMELGFSIISKKIRAKKGAPRVDCTRF